MNYSKLNKQQAIEGIKNDILYAIQKKHKRRNYNSIKNMHENIQKTMQEKGIKYSDIIIDGQPITKIMYFRYIAPAVNDEINCLIEKVRLFKQDKNDFYDYSSDLHALYSLLDNSSENMVKAESETTRPKNYNIIIARYNLRRAYILQEKLEEYRTRAIDLLADTNLTASYFETPPAIPNDLMVIKKLLIIAMKKSRDPSDLFLYHNYKSSFLPKKTSQTEHNPINDVVDDILYTYLKLYINHIGLNGKEIIYFKAFRMLLSDYKLKSSYLGLSHNEINKKIYSPVTNCIIKVFKDIQSNMDYYIANKQIRGRMFNLVQDLRMLPKKIRIESLDNKGYSYLKLENIVKSKIS